MSEFDNGVAPRRDPYRAHPAASAQSRFSRTGDPMMGEFRRRAIAAQFGNVPDDLSAL